MMIRMTGDGRVFQGTPKQIVEEMQALAFGQDHRTVGEYTDWVVEQVERFESTKLTVEGETDEEKAESLVLAIVRAGLAEKL